MRDLLHRKCLDAGIQLLVAHVVCCLTGNKMNVQLRDHVWLHMLIKIIRCVEVLMRNILDDCCSGDTLSTVTLVDCLG